MLSNSLKIGPLGTLTRNKNRHVITPLILIPFIGGFLCWQTERFGVRVPRWIALVTMGLTLALGLQLWLQGGYSLTQSAGIPQWQSEFLLPRIPRFGINIHLALDGLSLLMVVLTGFLGVLAVLCSRREIEKYQGFFHLNLMWIWAALSACSRPSTCSCSSSSGK